MEYNLFQLTIFLYVIKSNLIIEKKNGHFFFQQRDILRQ